MVVSNDLPYDLIVLHLDFRTSSTTTTAATATKSYNNNDKKRKKKKQKKGDVSLMEAFKVLGFMERKSTVSFYNNNGNESVGFFNCQCT